MDKNEIISALRRHKRNIAIYESLLNENDVHIPAQVITDMPKALNKFSSSVENAVIGGNIEARELWKEIRRVNIWLEALDEEERFVLEQLYMENKSYVIIGHKWSGKCGNIYSERYWKYKRRNGIKKIFEILH